MSSIGIIQHLLDNPGGTYQYLLASPGYVLDISLRTFIPVSYLKRGDKLGVPYFLWNNNQMALLRLRGIKLEKTKYFYLVDSDVSFDLRGVSCRDNAFGVATASVSYCDRQQDRFRKIEVTARPEFYTINDKYRMFLCQFEVLGGGLDEVLTVEYDVDSPSTFEPIDELLELSCTIGTFAGSGVYGGIRHAPFRIKYRGRPTKVYCYAFMYGTWAILFNYDFMFDSVVLLRGADKEFLDIERIVHTVNSKLVKAKMLLRYDKMVG